MARVAVIGWLRGSDDEGAVGGFADVDGDDLEPVDFEGAFDLREAALEEAANSAVIEPWEAAIRSLLLCVWHRGEIAQAISVTTISRVVPEMEAYRSLIKASRSMQPSSAPSSATSSRPFCRPRCADPGSKH